MIYLFVCIIWWCYACVSLEFNIIWHIWGFYVLFLEIQLYSHWEWYQNTSIFFLRKWYNEVISYLIKIDIVYNFADLTLAFKVQQNMTYLMFLLFVFGKPSIHQYRVFSETYLSIFGRQVIEWINQSSKMLIDCCCCFLYNLMMLYSCFFNSTEYDTFEVFTFYLLKSSYTTIESYTKTHQSIFVRQVVQWSNWLSNKNIYFVCDLMVRCVCTFKIQHNMTYLRFLHFVFGKSSIHQYRVFPKHINLFFSDKWYNEVIICPKESIFCIVWWY